MSLPQRFHKIIAFLIVAVLFSGCEEPYTPEVLDRPNNFLVVSGFINSNGPTTLQLSRTQNLSEESRPELETRATVTVEGENGEKFPLFETAPGTYSSGTLPLDPTKKYRLYIRASGKEYASEYVEVRETPDIDNVQWQAQPDGLQLLVNARGLRNETRYYRYEYEETWEYYAYYFSSLELVNGEIVNRAPENGITMCWRNDISRNILLTNTTKLSQDVVSNYPILKIPATSEKLKRKYSLLVKQIAQTRESYNYWEALKKNTESIGTLFDPLPTQLTGNIKCLTEPSEPVIGFVTVTSVKEKRIFVRKDELPNSWLAPNRFCPLDTIEVDEAVEFFSTGGFIPIDVVLSPDNQLIGYTTSSRPCVDCRVYGTTEKPAFWQ